MKDLLIVSFYFPPIMSAGAVRIGKFAKYLTEYGWNPIVLTVEPKSNIAQGIPVEIDDMQVVRTAYHDPVGLFSKPPSVDGKTSQALGKERSKEMSLREWVKKYSPFTIQRMPDRMLGWYLYAVRAGRKIIEWDKIGAVFSSHPSPVSHLIAAKLSKKAGLPWVADYRDLWTGSTLRPYPKWLEAVERKFERRALKNAAVLTTVSEGLKDYLADLHEKPVEIIYNGFDPEDFKGKKWRKNPNAFTLVYSGTLYTSKQSPVPLFEALKNLLDEGAISKENFRVYFIGVQEPPFKDLVFSYGLGSIVVSKPFQPYGENVAALKGADALLFFSWNEGEMEGNPTSKIFQYAGAGRPILVVGKGNRFAVEFVEETRVGETAENPDEIAGIISHWMNHIEYLPNGEALKPYNRKVQAGQLAAILDRVAS